MERYRKDSVDDQDEGIQINFPSQPERHSSSTSLQRLLCNFANDNLEDSTDNFDMPHIQFWTNLFHKQFLVESPELNLCDGACDDMLFYVRKKPSGSQTKDTAEVEVFRRNSSRLPSLLDQSVEWEETVYLNIIMQHFVYIVTVGVCTRTGPQEMQILRKFSKEVYASPSRRKMDSKGTHEEIVYPNIFFTIDNFEEIFCDCVIRDSESICVELTAYDRCGNLQGVIFLGSIRYDALKLVYDRRTTTGIGSSTWHLPFSWGTEQRVEFIRMRGPHGKGHAEMALRRTTTVNGSDDRGNPIGDSANTTPVPSRYQSHNNLFWKPSSSSSSGVGVPPFQQTPKHNCSSTTLARPTSIASRNDGIHSQSTSTNASTVTHQLKPKTVSASADTSPSHEWRRPLVATDRRQSEVVNDSYDVTDDEGPAKPGYSSFTNGMKMGGNHAASFQLLPATETQHHHPAVPPSSSSSSSSWWSGSLKKAASESCSMDRVGIHRKDEVQAYHVEEEFDTSQSDNVANSWSRSFGQAWYWFKEKRRNTSMAMNVYLTYITLPWYRIVADVIEVRQQPLLTFNVD